MPTEYWRSPETIDHLNRLERPGFAVEFLRRNADYRRDFARTQRQIARASRRCRDRPRRSRSAMGVAFSPMTRVFPSGLEPVTWLPELSPGTLILETAPSGFEPLSSLIPRNSAQSSLIDTDDEGRELVVVDGSGELHIRSARRSDRHTFCRSAAARHLVRTSARRRTALRPPSSWPAHQTSSLRPSPDASAEAPARPASARLRRSRTWGRPTRRRGEMILRSEHARLPSVEWKDFPRPAHRQPSHSRLDCARRTRLSQTSARRLTRTSDPPERTAITCARPALRLRRDISAPSPARTRGDTPPRKSLSTPNA